MPDQNTHKFYDAYVQNVRDLLIAEGEIRRAINKSLKQGNKSQTVTVNTKLYALIYSTFSEARFMKMILTPYGFNQLEVNEILNKESILEKWQKCIDLAFRKFNLNKKGSEVPNKKQELLRIVKEYIVNPSLIRNKIAHGQLTIALNRKNTGLNAEMTEKINNINLINVSIWFKVNLSICDIIEELIESPEKAHYNNYYRRLQELESYIEKTKNWNIESKMQTPSMKKRRIINP